MLSLRGQNTNHFQHVVTTPFQDRRSMVRYGDCCPQHPNSNHTWINCFCNPRNIKNRSNFHHNGSHPNLNNHVNSHRETRPSEFHGHNLMYHNSRNYRNEQGYKRPYYNPKLTQSTTLHTSSALVPYNPHNTRGEKVKNIDDEFHLKVQETVRETPNIKFSMPGAFQTHYHHIDALSLYQEGMD